jgi:hypothetical protein
MKQILALTSCLALLALGAPANAADLTFKPEGDAFAFDTGVLKGKLRANKKTFGLIPVTHTPTGQALSRSMGLFGIYRVFSDGQRHGTGAWDWPGEAKLLGDGSVLVTCAATPQRPFDLAGHYRWAGAATMDLEITVTPKQTLKGFEAFLASYFDSAFSNASACVQTATPQPIFQRAEKSLADWLIFPRDAQAVPLIQDGRWKIEPNPVEWKIQSPLARPLCVRRAPASGLTAVLMAPPGDCFAIAMPYETEGHYSMYFSLFGRDLKAGETARARARLQLSEKPGEPQILKAYEDYLASLAGK